MSSGEERMSAVQSQARGRWFFLAAFVFACLLFWWAPSLVFHFLAGLDDGVEGGTVMISIAALVLFGLAYLLPFSNDESRCLSEGTLDACSKIAFFITVALFPIALLLAIHLWSQRVGFDYGAVGSIPIGDQAVLYTHLFFGLMFFGSAAPKRDGRHRVLIGLVLFALPRLIISTHGGRFYLAQAAVPALLIAVGRGWIRFSFRRVIQIMLLAALILFGPSITRGDAVFGQGEFADWLSGGSTLKLYQDHIDDNLQGHCNPFLVAFTAKVIPFKLIGECLIDFGDRKDEPETLDRILAVETPGTFHGTVGPGSNYLLDLGLFGGLLAVFVGSACFGFSCRRFVAWVGMRSPYAGIWAECLTRALFAPRGNLGYVYERVPSLVLATWLIVLA